MNSLMYLEGYDSTLALSLVSCEYPELELNINMLLVYSDKSTLCV